MSESPLLDVRNLSIAFRGVTVVDDISFSLRAGEMLALVGESGCGKSVTAWSILQLLQPGGVILPPSQILYRGTNLLGLPEKQIQQIRGHRIAIVPQG